MRKQLKADLSLLAVTMVWGLGFVIMKIGLNYVSTYNLLAFRFWFAFFALGIMFRKNILNVDKKVILYSLILGSFLFGGFAFMTTGLKYTTASKSGFIVGFSVVLVPIFSIFILKQRPSKMAIFGVVLAFIGLFLLSYDSSTGINRGDVYTLIGAILYALHIIFVGKYTSKVHSLTLAAMQMLVVASLSTITSLLIEVPKFPRELKFWGIMIIVGVFATAFAFGVQTYMQQYTTPTHTGLIFSGEPVFSAITAYIVLSEVIPFRGIVGSILIVCGIIISELKIEKNWVQRIKMRLNKFKSKETHE